MKVAALLLVAALSIPAHADPCPDTVVVLCGKAFTLEEAEAPGFDPCKARQRIDWCDGVLQSADEAARIFAVEDERDRLAAQLGSERELRAIERRQHDRDLGACQEGRKLCEADRTVCPTCPEPGMSPWAAGAIGAGTAAVVFTVLLLAFGGGG